jgi:hypothetical protein
MSTDDLVVVATFSTWMQAQFAQSMLESAGIESHLSNEFCLASGWHLTGAIADGMHLFVHASDAADALAILREADESKE